MTRSTLCLSLGLALALACAQSRSFADASVATPHADAPTSLPKSVRLDLGGGLFMDFVLIPAGRFQRGSPEEVGDEDETPRREVSLTQPFYLGVFEVTQEQWTRVMGDNPSHFKGLKHPVDSVSWDECQRFLAKLTALVGRRVALPTEAQWEYACRAGTDSRWFFGEKAEALGEYAWFAENSGGQTHPVGQKKPNAWGVCDLYGNLGEWCADWYANPYLRTPSQDPQGPVRGVSRCIRGGAWGDSPGSARSAYRNANGPDGANDGIGFRCLLPVVSVPPAAEPPGALSSGVPK